MPGEERVGQSNAESICTRPTSVTSSLPPRICDCSWLARITPTTTESSSACRSTSGVSFRFGSASKAGRLPLERSWGKQALRRVTFKGCSIDFTFYELYDNVPSDRRALFLAVYALVLGTAAYKLHSRVLGDVKEELEADQIQHASSDDYATLLKEKAAERFNEERDCDGLMIRSAYYGERRELEEYRRARQGEMVNPDAMMSPSVRDITIPLRFWVKNSALYFPAGPKPFFHTDMARPDDPAIFIM